MSKCSEQCAQNSYLLITGITTDCGEKFRPASIGLEWSQRIAGWLAIENPIAACKQCLIPGISEEGIPTLKVNESLKICKPEIHGEVMKFAQDNKLGVFNNESSESIS